MADKTVRNFGPLALTNVLTTNVYNGGNGGTATIYDVIRTILITNKTAGAVTVSLWLGASAGNVAGTEILNAVSIPANTAVPYYFSPGLRMESTDFLVGGASAATSLSITGMGVQAVK